MSEYIFVTNIFEYSNIFVTLCYRRTDGHLDPKIGPQVYLGPIKRMKADCIRHLNQSTLGAGWPLTLQASRTFSPTLDHPNITDTTNITNITNITINIIPIVIVNMLLSSWT